MKSTPRLRARARAGKNHVDIAVFTRAYLYVVRTGTSTSFNFVPEKTMYNFVPEKTMYSPVQFAVSSDAQSS